ncbi:uncharacterized protein KY384_006843 [Bacidia gigantensis]|uniref:uncharacterized protein n=1 Tax=Bacidia gigantensis TaxID=2732470 RepID=UPI001D059245|nr:uncharacterized protein KY384_006843 [Bacidia gigantensis]KAG8527927.1 hypothetical protein KY384_006843 [Bacidia gigantensis]
MSNKYSYAVTLSHYEQQGFADFTNCGRSRTSKACTMTAQRATKATKTKTSPIHMPNRPAPQERLRLHQPQDSWGPETSLICCSEVSAVPPPNGSKKDVTEPWRTESLEDDDFYNLYPPSYPPLPTHDHEVRIPRTRKKKDVLVNTFEVPEEGPSSLLSHQPTSTSKPLGPRADNVKSSSMHGHKRRLTSETVIWDPRSPSRTSDEAIRVDTAAKQQSRMSPLPMTPPLTPKAVPTVDDFSLELYLAELPQPRPFQLLHAGPTPPSSDSASSNTASSAGQSHETQLRRPEISTEQAPIIPKRSSSLTRKQSKHNPLESQHSSTIVVGVLPNCSDEDSLDLDADLEPLPLDLANDPDFAPWLENLVLPDIPRFQRSNNTLSSCASSFDSAAPPPIAITRKTDNSRGKPLHRTEAATSKPQANFSVPFMTKRHLLEKYEPKERPYNLTTYEDLPTIVGVTSQGAPRVPDDPSASQSALSTNRSKAISSVESKMNKLRKKEPPKPLRRKVVVKLAGETFYPPGSKRSSWFGGIDWNTVAKEKKL